MYHGFFIVPQEIIQNADDAGATVVHFYLDNRQHGTGSLVEPKLAEFQGPALLAYNDAVFTDDDWQSIQDLQQSGKTKDPFKVGKFGIGFNSVYHITGSEIHNQCFNENNYNRTCNVAVRGDMGLESSQGRRDKAKLKWWYKLACMEDPTQTL